MEVIIGYSGNKMWRIGKEETRDERFKRKMRERKECMRICKNSIEEKIHKCMDEETNKERGGEN